MNERPYAASMGRLSEFEEIELADYLPASDEQLYYVLHQTTVIPKGRALLLGPFVSERPHRYIPWVKWARHLARAGYEAMRFDYRGCGESTGRFEDFDFDSWRDDAGRCHAFLASRAPRAPIVLHGLGLGALLADELFREGLGDALVQWLPPKSGRDMLYQQLQLRLANDFVLQPTKRRTRDQYVADLERGEALEVEGYSWTRRLWESATAYNSDEATEEGPQPSPMARPRTVTQLDPCGAHMLGGIGPNPLRQEGERRQLRLLNPDLSRTFDEVVSWLDAAVGPRKVI
jgi:alpha/beta superfamily hydrolase